MHDGHLSVASGGTVSRRTSPETVRFTSSTADVEERSRSARRCRTHEGERVDPAVDLRSSTCASVVPLRGELGAYDALEVEDEAHGVAADNSWMERRS